jgi:glycosyltransferase involved in cell wall biosynthesis
VRIHFHTDNYWFSGSETTLMVLLDAAQRDPGIESVFTYVSWPEYTPGLGDALPSGVTARALDLPDPAGWKARAIGTGGEGRSAVVRAVARAMPLRKAALAMDVPRLTRLFEETNPDVVHINNGGFPGAISCNAAAMAARRAGVAGIVYVVNNLALGYRRPSRWTDRPIDRRVVDSVSSFVTGSHAAARQLERVVGIRPEQTRVIPNTVVPKAPTGGRSTLRRALGVADDAPVALVVARLERRKGHAVLLRGLAAAAGRSWTLLIAGDGPERAGLERLAAALGFGDRVRFLGHRRDVADLLAATDVVVLPSIGQEDFPIVTLEAMAAGRAVVATRVAGSKEQVVDGETGRLVPVGDEHAVASAVLEVLADPERREAMGAAGRRRFEEHYDRDAVVGQYRDLWTEVSS